MSRAHSFKITVSNNRTEKEGLEYLRRVDSRFVLIERAARSELMDRFEIAARFSRAFDLIYVHRRRPIAGVLTVRSLDSIDLVEIKTTKARLPRFPAGFFFGATKNEFDLGEQLGDRYKFCLVCLHQDTRTHTLLSLKELQALIRTQRIQYQINL